MTPITVLGIDPGYDRIGWAVGTARGQVVQVVEYGCIVTTKTYALFERYRELDSALAEIIARLHPTEVALESLFFFRNKTTALTVSEARGVLISRCLQNNLGIFEYTPMQVKQSVTGSGRADKNSVAKMVRLQGHIPPSTKLLDDTTDAIAVLLTHAASRGISGITSGNNLLRLQKK